LSLEDKEALEEEKFVAAQKKRYGKAEEAVDPREQFY